jgi:hypothetical protein
MKSLVRASLVVLTICAAAAAVSAADSGQPVQRVLFRESKVVVVRAGTTAEISNNLTLPNAIVVSTNGTFRVGNGKDRMFKEGQSLSVDGTLLSPDGTVMPVFDHVVMQKGRTVVVKDGQSAVVTADLTLGNGGRISPDGTFVDAQGRRAKLLDGQMVRLTGQIMPSVDTITLINGKVVLQKDGSRIEVSPSQTVAMSDGTKVFGIGSVIKRDGTRVTLSDGQILTVEGVSTRPR